MRQSLSPVFRSAWLILLLDPAMSLPAVAQEPKDWIDEFPSVTAAAQAARAEYALELRGVAVDYTWDAANVAATFKVLREIVVLKQRQEPSMSSARQEKLKRLVAGYLEAELTVGRGWLARALSDSARPSVAVCDSEDCYRSGFLVAMNGRSGRASYRDKVLVRLFPCGNLATELNELRQRASTQSRVPSLASPANTLSIEAGNAGIGPVGCDSYGADSNRNGICDDWEAVRRRDATEPERSCGTLTLTRATTPNARGIEVEYTVDAEWQPRRVEFSVYRSARPALDGSAPVAQPSLDVPVDTNGAAANVLLVAESVDLAPNTNKPYVVVVARYGGKETSAWFKKHLVGVLVHGYTFRRLYEAVNAVSRDGGIVLADWLFDGPAAEPWQQALASTLERMACYDPATFAFSWRHESRDDVASLLAAKAEELSRRISATAAGLAAQHNGDVVDLHLIGHSRGAVMVSRVLVEWATPRGTEAPGRRGGHVIVTLLDPHPASNIDTPIQEDYDPDNLLSAKIYTGYKSFQDQAKDPPIVLPEGVGIREIQLLYQQSTVEQVNENEPTRDGAFDFVAEWFSDFYLWGQNEAFVSRRNSSGVPVQALRLTRHDDGETVTHSGVVSWYAERYGAVDPDRLAGMSPERGDCKPIYRF
jgi:hypothetical protein